jgi:glucose-6-phosphate isomerase
MACGQESNNPNKYFAGNRPSSMLIADRLTPEAMGALLALYEAKIVFQGFAWNINSFDQEGVQLGKVLATQFLVNIHTKEQKDKGLHQEILKITGIV